MAWLVTVYLSSLSFPEPMTIVVADLETQLKTKTSLEPRRFFNRS